jgi:RNA polymerase sigma factor (sigma-70 family)
MKMQLPVGKGTHRKEIYPMVVKMAAKTYGNFAVAQLEDVISEGVVEALTESKRFDATRGVSISTFIYRAVQGAMRDYMKRETTVREPWETDESATRAMHNVPAPDTLEEGHSNRKLFLEVIDYIEKNLHDEMGAILVRAYLEGKSDEEIAKEYGLKKKAVRIKRNKALAQVRAYFAIRGRNEAWVG